MIPENQKAHIDVELIEMFLSSMPANFLELEVLVAEGNLMGAKAAAHLLRAPVLRIGARHLHDLCREMEYLSHIEAAAPLMERIRVEHMAVNARLRESLRERD